MKKILHKVTAFVLAVVLFIVCLFFIEEKALLTSTNKISYKKTIIIDAGHGGYDGGATASDGTNEKNINLAIAKNLKEFLLYFGFDVIMTRESDISTSSTEDKNKWKLSDLENRIKLMKDNKDAIFISIHLNKFTTSSAKGAQVFYSQNSEFSDILAQSIQTNIKKLLQPENERVVKKGTKGIYILKNAVVPSVIVECGFLSNKSDLENLKKEKYQTMMAFSIFCGIIDYYSEAGK